MRSVSLDPPAAHAAPGRDPVGTTATQSASARYTFFGRSGNSHANSSSSREATPVVAAATATATATTRSCSQTSDDASTFSFADAVLDELRSASARSSLLAKTVVVKCPRNKSGTDLDRGSLEPREIVRARPRTPLLDEPTTPTNPATVKRVSKLMRPKSYPNKEPSSSSDSGKSSAKVSPGEATAEPSIGADMDVADAPAPARKPVRPKSYPASKLTPPKDTQRSSVKLSNGNGDAPAATSPSPSPEKPTKVKSAKAAGSGPAEQTDKVVKVKKVKIVKKVAKTSADGGPIKPKSGTPTKSTAVPAESVSKPSADKVAAVPTLSTVQTPPPSLPSIEKSPEKKTARGFLYSIGQKFERLRENSKSSKLKKPATDSPAVAVDAADRDSPGSSTTEDTLSASPVSSGVVAPDAETDVGNGHAPQTAIEPTTTEPTTTTRKSRIDSAMRMLRDRSGSRTNAPRLPPPPPLTPPPASDANRLQRALSVEQLVTCGESFNRRAVNRVLGLFRKFDKDAASEPTHTDGAAPDAPHAVQAARSSGHVNTLLNATAPRDRPKSTSFVSRLRRVQPSDSTVESDAARKECAPSVGETMATRAAVDCPECACNGTPTDGDGADVVADLAKRSAVAVAAAAAAAAALPPKTPDDRERMRHHRRGLLLDFSKLEQLKQPPVHHVIVGFAQPANNNHVPSNAATTATATVNQQQQQHMVNNNYRVCTSPERRATQIHYIPSDFF